VTPALREAVEALHPSLARQASYHLGWREADGSPTVHDGGKVLRPTLSLLAAEAAGGTPGEAVPSAVAVELVHNFSILHDDVMDRDTERRHRPSTWSVFGDAGAILTGDALFAVANATLLDAHPDRGRRALNRLLAATGELIRGQAADLDFEQRLDVTFDECLAMASGKTGALMSCACAAGAALAGAPEPTVDALGDYGRHLGLAYQAVDDVLGIWGHPETTGKPAGNDLRQQKKSLPVTAALHDGACSERLRALLGKDEIGDEDVSAAVSLVEASGARQRVDELADAELTRALEALDRVALVEAAREELADVARFAVAREF
jgi:geranylgeranyl diphosphate synthase type I